MEGGQLLRIKMDMTNVAQTRDTVQNKTENLKKDFIFDFSNYALPELNKASQSLSLKEILLNQIHLIAGFKNNYIPTQKLKEPNASFRCELWSQALSNNKELSEMREYYRKLYLITCWRAFFGFYTTYLVILLIALILVPGLNQQAPTAVVVCIAVICILSMIDVAVQIKNELIEYVFMFILLFEGVYINYEGNNYLEYRFHEPWLLFYSTFLIFSISCCFHWKRMMFLYWIVQLYNFIMLHVTYDNLGFYFYAGYAFVTVLLPLVCMIIARIILVFLLLIHNNQELVKVIYKVLQIFPEGFLVQQQDSQTQSLVVQFVNDTAAKEILDYESPCGRPIDDDKLNYCVRKVNNLKDINPNDHANERRQFQSLSKLLQIHVNQIKIQNNEAVDSIELCSHNEAEIGNNQEDSDAKFYNLKTVQVNFGSNKKSFIHVFINTTSVKHFEMEKARNECLQLMFSSVSHEFRTPMNAFTNSILLLENNYNVIIQNIKEFTQREIHDKILIQKICESNERFFKICKISTASLMSLVEDILDLAKIEAGTFNLNEQLFPVKNLVQDIEYIFSFQCLHKGLTFCIEVDDILLSSTFCSDIGRIKQILMNLISNAYKFTPTGGISLRIKSIQKFDEFSFERVRFLEFKVADTGIGISELEMNDLFKMFGTCNRERRQLNCRGTGIGLTISKKLTESLGGTINLNSREGLGTEVSFTVKEKKNIVNSREEVKNQEESNNEPSFFSSDIYISMSSLVPFCDTKCDSVRVSPTQACNLSEKN